MMRRIAVAALCTGAGCAHDRIVSPTTAPDWESAFVRSDGWTGADGAATIPLPGGRTLWLFGDTWIGQVRDGRHIEGSTMVNNTIAVCAAIPDRPEPDDIRFLWGTCEGKPAGWVVPTQESEWFWPAGGGLIAPDTAGNPRLLLFMARLARLDRSGSVWNFDGRGSSLVIVHNPADEPERWRPSQRALNSYKHGDPPITWGVAALRDSSEAGEPTLLIYGIDSTSGLNKKVLLARAPATRIEDFTTWTFRTASGWSSSPSAAAPIVENVSSELSVCRHPRGNGWVMIHSEPPLGSGIMARTAPAPEGPWSAPIKLYTCPEPAADTRMMAYSAKAHPELSGPGEVLVSYSVNSTDFWDVAAYADKYRPRFVRIPLGLLGRSSP
jgi:hypothetical protein